jgi:hypothetical protein
MRHDIQPGDRVIWLRSPGRSFLTGWRVAEVSGIVVRVCPRRIKIKIVLNEKEKTVIVDPDNVIRRQEMKDLEN